MPFTEDDSVCLDVEAVKTHFTLNTYFIIHFVKSNILFQSKNKKTVNIISLSHRRIYYIFI